MTMPMRSHGQHASLRPDTCSPNHIAECSACGDKRLVAVEWTDFARWWCAYVWRHQECLPEAQRISAADRVWLLCALAEAGGIQPPETS